VTLHPFARSLTSSFSLFAGISTARSLFLRRFRPNYAEPRLVGASDDSAWKYVPVRRLVVFIEESISRATQWAAFEPDDETLWASLRLQVGAFMDDLFKQGYFQGESPRDAYFVICGSGTTTQSDIDNGVVNVVVGFAPLKPAEFVIIQIQQMAGQLKN
jgi:uncharacterized protein